MSELKLGKKAPKTLLEKVENVETSTFTAPIAELGKIAPAEDEFIDGESPSKRTGTLVKWRMITGITIADGDGKALKKNCSAIVKRGCVKKPGDEFTVHLMDMAEGDKHYRLMAS